MPSDFNSIRSAQLTRSLAQDGLALQRQVDTFDLQTVGDQTVLSRLIGQNLYFSRIWGAGWADRENRCFRFLTPVNVLGFIPENMFPGGIHADLLVLPIDNGAVTYIYIELSSGRGFSAADPGNPDAVGGFSLLYNEGFLIKSDTDFPMAAEDGTTFVQIIHEIQPVVTDKQDIQTQQDFYEP